MQDSGKSVFTADSEYVPLLLTFVSDHGNREVAMVWGAQRVFEDRQRPKGCAPHVCLICGAASDECYRPLLKAFLSKGMSWQAKRILSSAFLRRISSLSLHPGCYGEC